MLLPFRVPVGWIGRPRVETQQERDPAPGVVMSLLGAPLFIGLLFTQRRRLVSL